MFEMRARCAESAKPMKREKRCREKEIARTALSSLECVVMFRTFHPLPRIQIGINFALLLSCIF